MMNTHNENSEMDVECMSDIVLNSYLETKPSWKFDELVLETRDLMISLVCAKWVLTK
ncbi:hypothetical protein HanIR_Chr03g0116421 [Helianthus annuus]|nr:hypothetical protein HanIR_Chr03g0116421 [Helianthus annuus]